MAAEAKQVHPVDRSCGRCQDDMEAVELRSGAIVWRCPSCRQLEI